MLQLASLIRISLGLILAAHTCFAAQTENVPSQLRLPLTLARGGRAFVNVMVDKKPAVLLLDSGSPVSFVNGGGELNSNKDAPVVVRGIAGQSTTTHAREVSIDFGHTIIATLSVKVVDLTAFRESTTKNDGWPPIDGAIGSDLLNIFKAKIDYHQQLLILNVPKA